MVAIALLLLAVACGKVVPGTGIPWSTAAVTPPADDAVDRDAQWYAAEYGLDLEEARRRLALQDTIGALNVELAEVEQATFAGLWVEHTPKFQLFVRFTEQGAQTLQPYVEGGLLEGMVEVRDAAASLEELRAAHQTTLAAIEGLGLDVASALNVVENQVEVFCGRPGLVRRTTARGRHPPA
jgi:hypothetical protein